MPCNEALWLADENKKAAMRKKLGIPESKKVILYAPTWREPTDGGKSYAIKPPIHFDESYSTPSHPMNSSSASSGLDQSRHCPQLPH